MVARAQGAWARALEVRPWEWRRLVPTCLLFGTLTWGQALGGTALQALFFFGSGVENLPLVFVLSAVLTVPTTALYAVALERLGIDRMFWLLLAVLILAAVGTRGVLGAHGSAAEPLFAAYLAYLVLLSLGMLQFWNYASRLFDTLEAKRLFPQSGLPPVWASSPAALPPAFSPLHSGPPTCSWYGRCFSSSRAVCCVTARRAWPSVSVSPSPQAPPDQSGCARSYGIHCSAS